jgi:hypothetical protein
MRDSDEPIRPSLTEAFTVNGEWWLPNAPEERVSGRLTFEPGELPTLRTRTGFPSLPLARLLELGSKSLPVALIMGRSDRGRSWSAVNCIPVSFSASFAGLKSEPCDFAPEYLLVSREDLPDRALYRELHIQHTHLAEWVNPFPTQKVKVPNIRIHFSTRGKSQFSTRIPDPRGMEWHS